MKPEQALKEPQHAYQVYSDRIPFDHKSNGEIVASCPFHQESTPSLKLFTRDGSMLWKCFGCGKTGNVFQFVELFDNCSFADAVTKVEAYGQWEKVRTEVAKTFAAPLAKKEKFTLHVSAIAEAEGALAGSADGINALAQRGISLDTAKRNHVGFIQDATAISADHPWARQGWLVFPTILGDQVICVKYRSIMGKKAPDGTPGFLRKSGMASGLFNGNSINAFEDCYVVEGEFDSLVLSQAGFVGVSLPSAGFSPTAEMRDTMMNANRVYLAGDMDSVGQATMQKLWAELKDRCYLIQWPTGCKDANDCFLKVCGGDVEKFKAKMEELRKKSHEQPLPHLYDLQNTLYHADTTPPMDDPNRMHFPPKMLGMDSWTPIVPGDICCIFASETGTGKTSFLMNVLIHNAIHHNKIVINYSAELLPNQYARRVASHLTGVNKDALQKEDFIKAADALQEARFFNGYRPGADWRKVLELLTWAKRRCGGDIIAIDHIHFLVRGEQDEARTLSEAMRAFKDFAVEHNCIVVIVGQPRKASGNQRNRVVTLQDAKSSEAFGSDASQVFILHRDRMPNQTLEENQPIFSAETKVILDKSRESGTRATTLFFRGEICSFYPLHTQ